MGDESPGSAWQSFPTSVVSLVLTFLDGADVASVVLVEQRGHVDAPEPAGSLLRAYIERHGHAAEFLVLCSLLRARPGYRLVSRFYEDAFPDLHRQYFRHTYHPDRVLDGVLQADNIGVLIALHTSHRRLAVEERHLLLALQSDSIRCVDYVLRNIRLIAPVDRCWDTSKCPDLSQYPANLLCVATETSCLDVLVESFGRLPAVQETALRNLALPVALYRDSLRLLGIAGKRNLDIACQDGVSFLVSRSGLTFSEVPPLHAAVRCGSAEITDHLLARDDVEVDACSPRGSTALDYAGRCAAGWKVQKILKSAGASVSTPSPTPLEHRIKQGRLKSVQELVQYGAKISTVEDILAATSTGDIELLQFVQDEAKKNGLVNYRDLLRQASKSIRKRCP